VGDRNAADWYWALPPITRGLLTVYLVTGLSAYMGVLPLRQMYHDWSLTFKMVPEVWRLVTTYTFIGRPSLHWLFQLVWLAKYGSAYETARFSHNTADGITMVGVGCIAGLVRGAGGHACRCCCFCGRLCLLRGQWGMPHALPTTHRMLHPACLPPPLTGL
jgi:Derlin-2/3